MKPLLTTAFFAIAAILGSTSTYAETTVTYVSHGVPDGQGGFTFFDNRLDSTSGSGFASLSGNSNYAILSTHIDPRNPFVFDPTADIETFGIFGIETNYRYVKGPHYDDAYNFIGADFIVNAGTEYKYSWYTLTEYYEKNSEFVMKGEDFEDGYWDWDWDGEYPSPIYVSRWAHRAEDGTVIYYDDDFIAPSWPSFYFPKTHGIFDFQNSFVFYVDYYGNSRSISLYDSLANGAEHTFGEESSFLFPLSFIEISGITLAYNLPVPEPEIWVMLLTGLGIVGVVARRRRTRAAM